VYFDTKKRQAQNMLEENVEEKKKIKRLVSRRHSVGNIFSSTKFKYAYLVFKLQIFLLAFNFFYSIYLMS